MSEVIWNEAAAPAVTQLDDGTMVYRTCAWSPPGCHGVGCGLRVFVRDGQLVKVEGDPDHPITKGRLCVRCLTMKEYFYHPDRLLYPMKRVGKRGENKWERITWDEAYDTIIAKYNECRENYGINSVSVWAGTGREGGKYHFALCNEVFGSVNAVHPNSGWSCIVPRMAVMMWCVGSAYIEYDNAVGLKDRYDDPQWDCPKYMLIWGRDPLRSNADGLWGHSLVEMMKRGMKVINVDPRANWISARAEYHLQLRPGTDGALALAILHAIIATGRYNREFVDSWCYGFDELAERAANYTPEWAEAITGVPAEDIYAVAECLLEKPSTACLGLAIDQNPNCLQIAQAIYAMFAVTGNMDIPGGLFLGQPLNFGAMAENVVADAGGNHVLEGLAAHNNLGVEPLGHDKYPALDRIVNTTHPDYTLDVLETDQPYPLKFAFLQSVNVLAGMVEQPKRWYEALRKLDFIVASDLFMTPTIAGLADVVLPVSTSLEHDGVVTNNMGSQPGQLGAINKVLDNLGETKSDLEIMLDLHRRIYPDSTNLRFADAGSFLTNDISHMDGVDFDFSELKKRVVGQYHLEYRKYEKGLLRGDGQPGFSTPTGRIELYSTVLASLGEDPLPYYSEPKFSAVSRPDLAEDYPLILTTGARRFTSFHSEHRQIETLREIHQWPTVQINPRTAESLGVTDRSWVWVENPWGKVKLMAQLTPIVKEDVVSSDHGWWYPERGADNMFDVWEVSMNNLVPHEENGKLGFGTHYKSLPCRVYPAA